MKWQIYWQMYPPTQTHTEYWHLVVKNGNFTFLLLELILAHEVPDLPPMSIDLWKTTTPHKFHIVKNKHILMADVPPN